MEPLIPHRLAIHTMTTKSWSLAEACRAYSDAGIGGICPWVEHVEPLGASEAARIIDDSGLRVPSFVRGGFFVCEAASEAAAAVDRTRELLDHAATLGAEMLVIVAGALRGIPLDTARGVVSEALASLGEHADQVGVRLALEPLHPMYAADRSCVNTLRSASEICDRIGHRSLGVALDVYHVWWEPHLEEQITGLGAAGRLLGFHVCDYKAETRHLLLDRGLMGEGVIPIRRIRGVVERAGFSGLVEVEIFSEQFWAMPPAEFLDLIIQAAADSA